jgi:class 3 adenylate cyclase
MLLERIRFGIGVHAGLAIAGEIGYERHAQFTAIGYPVNVASRLQALTKSLSKFDWSGQRSAFVIPSCEVIRGVEHGG